MNAPQNIQATLDALQTPVKMFQTQRLIISPDFTAILCCQSIQWLLNIYSYVKAAEKL